MLYHDVVDEEQKKLAVAALAGHSHEAYRVPMTFSMQEVKTPKTFVICKNDKVFSVEMQNIFVNASQSQKVVEVETGHSPFLVKEGLDALVKTIVEAPGN